MPATVKRINLVAILLALVLYLSEDSAARQIRSRMKDDHNVNTSSESTREVQEDSARESHKSDIRYLGILGLGVMTGPAINGNGASAFTMKMIHGVQVGAHFSVGVGFEHYPDFSMVPVFLDVRTYLLGDGLTPFLYFDAGYSESYRSRLSDAGGGGLVINGGIGFSIPVGGVSSILVDFGDKYQQKGYAGSYQVGGPYYYYDQYYLGIVSYNFFVTTIGISF